MGKQTIKLSIVIPVYNERRTLPLLLVEAVQALPAIDKEILVVDDGSRDGTREWLALQFGSGAFAIGSVQSNDNADPVFLSSADAGAAPSKAAVTVRVILHERNGGKGKAVRTGFSEATGDVVVIQDADLEYDPADWTTMFSLFQRGVADVVYGSRFYGKPHRVLYFYHLLGNKAITWFFNLLFNQTLSDLETCYKMFRRSLLEGATLQSTDFGIEVELTALFATSPQCRIYETGIAYYGRTYAEGKKIGWRDGVKALWYVIKFRLSPPRRAA